MSLDPLIYESGPAGVPHPDGAICESLPPAIDEIGHALAQAGGISGWCLIC